MTEDDIKAYEQEWLDAQAAYKENPEDTDLYVEKEEAKQRLAEAVGEKRRREGRTGLAITAEGGQEE